MKKRHNTFDYERNRKRNSRKKKKMPDIKCDQIKSAWDPKKSIKKNLKEMGISTDANKSIRLPRNVPKSALLSTVMEVDDVEKTPVKKFVVDGLETTAKLPHKKRMTMSDEEAGFCVEMIDKHGDDYEAMSRDRRNYYQETPAKIRKKILRFQSIPEMYNMYAEARTGLTDTLIHTSPAIDIDTDTDDYPASPPALSPEPFLGMAPNRCSTRLYDAGLRNGHFFSPQMSPPTKTTIYAPHATLCRVRKRLHFGRKAPKERNGPDQGINSN